MLPTSGTLSPNGSKTPHIVTRTIENTLRNIDSLEDKILELKEFWQEDRIKISDNAVRYFFIFCFF